MKCLALLALFLSAALVIDYLTFDWFYRGPATINGITVQPLLTILLGG